MASLQQDDSEYLKSLALEARNGNDNSIMDMVKEFPCIYNRASPDSKDRNIKANAWRKISELLDPEESKCKQKYESIRTTFSRYVKKAVGKSGSGGDDIPLEPKYEHLSLQPSLNKTYF